MKTKRIFVPRQREIGADAQIYLDNTGLAYEVPEQCPEKWPSLNAFANSDWHPHAACLGHWYRCLHCWEASDDEENTACIYLEKENGYGVYHCLEQKRMGDNATSDFLGYLCPNCAKTQLKRNMNRDIPEPPVLDRDKEEKALSA